MATKSSKPDVISDREASRLANHWLELDHKRLELGREVTLITKEQDTIRAKISGRGRRGIYRPPSLGQVPCKPPRAVV